MVVRVFHKPTKPELNMELDTVMLNAHKMLNSSMDRPMSMDGTHHQVTQILEKDNGVLVAPRWIFGKPTVSQVRSLLIHASMMVFSNVITKVIAVILTDTAEFVIKMVVISTRSELESQISSVQDLNSQSTLLNHSLL
jgi:hypothetical protein